VLTCSFLACAEEQVQAALNNRHDAPVDGDANDCATFKAADMLGKRLANYDRYGLAAYTCRHEFVLAACSLFGCENYTYYEVCSLSAVCCALNITSHFSVCCPAVLQGPAKQDLGGLLTQQSASNRPCADGHRVPV
jgi:hypothetical protein